MPQNVPFPGNPPYQRVQSAPPSLEEQEQFVRLQQGRIPEKFNIPPFQPQPYYYPNNFNIVPPQFQHQT